MSVLDNASLPENALIYDAQQALREGRAFPMTYARWENVLADMGQAYKEWFRGNGVDGPGCIARMDMLQRTFLNHSNQLYFCESTADFTLEETARLLGKALGSAVGADAALIPLGEFHDGTELRAGVTGKLYQGPIDTDTANAITPAYDGKYALADMTGAQVKELAQAGFDFAGDGRPFPYVLVTRGEEALEDGTVYRVALLMEGYTEAAAQTYKVRVEKGSLREFLRIWLEAQGTVSPDGNPWT